MGIKFEDQFFYYRSAIGNLGRFIERHTQEGIVPTEGFVTNAFGVKINPKHLPELLAGRDGIDDPPIPATWHADMAEFAAAIRAVELSGNRFTMVELGCGWGCWMNITGVIAKKSGREVRLIGVEGDQGHLTFATEALTSNGFRDFEWTLHRGVAGSGTGFAFFPIQEFSGMDWGLEPIFTKSEKERKQFARDSRFMELPIIRLQDLFFDGDTVIDLLHVDIQGGEVPLLAEAIDVLNENVKMVLVGTHGREIEGDLFKTFRAAGWILEIERPAVLHVGNALYTQVDGVQLWRNENLITGVQADGVSHQGFLEIENLPVLVRVRETLLLSGRIGNNSSTSWYSDLENFPVSIGYRWKPTWSSEWVDTGERLALPQDSLQPGQFKDFSIEVRAPEITGEYELMVTIVQDGISWFEEPEFELTKHRLIVVE